jgi:hypothetical protein
MSLIGTKTTWALLNNSALSAAPRQSAGPAKTAGLAGRSPIARSRAEIRAGGGGPAFRAPAQMVTP